MYSKKSVGPRMNLCFERTPALIEYSCEDFPPDPLEVVYY